LNILELAVLEFLTHTGGVYVCPEQGLQPLGLGKCPDFVALSLATDPPRIEVVEVTGHSDTTDLARKIGWYRDNASAIRDGLLHPGRPGTDEAAPLGVKVFILGAQIDNFKRQVGPELSESITLEAYALEDVFAALLDWRLAGKGSTGPRYKAAPAGRWTK
jgi:hypothetical protein